MFRPLPASPMPVKYDHAEQNLLYVLVGFAASVIVTRTFLGLTGYPQIASGDFHIAHVLWGGLLLFAASLILLIWRGRKIHWLSSLLTGVGFGLFIDEVGKFITQSNDYFYPLAAPLIYAFFLLTVFIYIRVRRLRNDSEQTEVYRVLDLLERSVDPDLAAQEKAQIQQYLTQIGDQSTHTNAARLAGSVLQFVQGEEFQRRPARPSILADWRERVRAAEARWLSPVRLKAALVLGFIFLALRGGLVALAAALFLLRLSDPGAWQQLTSAPWADGDPFGAPRLLLLTAVLVFEAVTGIIMLVAASLLLARRLQPGLSFGYWGLLFSLTALRLPILYFQQFGVIAVTLLQFALLLGVMRYRARYVEG